MSRDILMPIALDDIDVPEGRREVVAATVKRLADSIEQVGLRHPVTVRRNGERYELVAGRHRMEACRKLGREHVPACIVTMNKTEARLWEIAENLHRADLTKLERDEQVAEWIKLKEQVSVQLAPKPKGGRPESGVSAAARDLGVEETEAKRAVKVASLSDEAKEAAREAGLDNNRAALLAAAKQPIGEQVATIHRIHQQGKVAADPLTDAEALESQVAAIMREWNKASKEAREEFLLRIDAPVMGKQWA